MQHAYVVDQRQREELAEEGFRPGGPLAGLWKEPGNGMVQLWAHRYQANGPFIITKGKQSPPGYKAMWPLGYAKTSSGDATVALLGFSGKFAAPLGRGPAKTDNLYSTLTDEQGRLAGAGYGAPEIVAHVRPPGKSSPPRPALHLGRVLAGRGMGPLFHQKKRQPFVHVLVLFHPPGAALLWRYLLSHDGRSATGFAVGKPSGAQATYYRHKLEFLVDSPDGPRIKLTSERLAAPLDDGRLVKFKRPKTTVGELKKTSPKVPGKDAAILWRPRKSLIRP